MLQDGRLKGVKIGQQWRFNRSDVDRLLGAPPPAKAPILPVSEFNFPVHCMQTIQDLFSAVGQISAMVIDNQGKAVTRISHTGNLCQILLETPSGQAEYQQCWQDFARRSLDGSKHFTCPAGLQYIGAPIHSHDEQVALFLAGEFYWQPPDPREQNERMRRMAAIHNLPVETLQQAAASIPIIAPEQHARVESWPAAAAQAMESILHERVRFMDRLQRIANLTHIP